MYVDIVSMAAVVLAEVYTRCVNTVAVLVRVGLWNLVVCSDTHHLNDCFCEYVCSCRSVCGLCGKGRVCGALTRKFPTVGGGRKLMGGPFGTLITFPPTLAFHVPREWCVVVSTFGQSPVSPIRRCVNGITL